MSIEIVLLGPLFLCIFDNSRKKAANPHAPPSSPIFALHNAPTLLQRRPHATACRPRATACRPHTAVAPPSPCPRVAARPHAESRRPAPHMSRPVLPLPTIFFFFGGGGAWGARVGNHWGWSDGPGGAGRGWGGWQGGTAWGAAAGRVGLGLGGGGIDEAWCLPSRGRRFLSLAA